MSITFSSCFYIIKSKIDASIYIEWMTNLISIVNEFNLVIYTDEHSSKHIPPQTKDNHRIKIVVKPLDQFYNYKYRDYWVKNHEKNVLLNDRSCWELNMLWSEKIRFVKETVDRKYFDTEFYGWCDIGYFRNRHDDTHTSKLTKWGANPVVLNKYKEKVCYACVNNNNDSMNYLYQLVNKKNSYGLPVQEIPPNQVSIAGGFFFLHKDKIDWWAETYDIKLQRYFTHEYLVKDDQIVLVDCILSDVDSFTLFREGLPGLDNWFMFQRILIHL